MSTAAPLVRHRKPPRRGLEVAIVGAGFGGIAAAIELRRHGISDVTILDRAPDLDVVCNLHPGRTHPVELMLRTLFSHDENPQRKL